MKDLVKVVAFRNSLQSIYLDHDDEIEKVTNTLENYGIKYMDALHIAYCEHHKMDFLITTDKILVNASKRTDLFTNVINPLSFIMEVL